MRGGGNRLAPVSRRPSLQLIFTVTLTGILNNTLVTPAIPDILADLGVPDDRSGILVAAGSTAGIIVAPTIGFLADRFGRRVVLTTCLLIFGAFGLSAALAPTFEVLLVSRLLQGVGSAGLINLAVVLIGDYWSGAERTKLVGRNAAVITVGLATIPLLSGTVTDLFGWRATFAIYTVAFATAGWAWLSLEPSRPDAAPSIRDQLAGVSAVVREPLVAVTIVTGFFVFVMIFGLMLTVLPVHLAEVFGLGAAERGVVIALPAISSTLVAFNIDRIRRRVSVRSIVIGAAVAFLVAFSAMGLAGALWFVIAGTLLYGASEGGLVPTLQDLTVDAPPDEHRGAVVAVWVGAVRLGQTVGSLLGGLGIALLGTSGTLIAGSLVAGIIALFGFFGPYPAAVTTSIGSSDRA